jgi:hypothetical protein
MSECFLFDLDSVLKRLSKWCLDMFHCYSTLDLLLDLLHGDTTPRLGHASIHIWNRQISDEPSKSETHLQNGNKNLKIPRKAHTFRY